MKHPAEKNKLLKKKCNCREILRMEFIFSKIAGLQLATLPQKKKPSSVFSCYFVPFVDSLLTFCVVPI